MTIEEHINMDENTKEKVIVDCPKCGSKYFNVGDVKYRHECVRVNYTCADCDQFYTVIYKAIEIR